MPIFLKQKINKVLKKQKKNRRIRIENRLKIGQKKSRKNSSHKVKSPKLIKAGVNFFTAINLQAKKNPD